MRTILIVGGAGYIGSHVNKALHRKGYGTIVLDNLVYGHREAVKWGEFILGDMSDAALLDLIFSRFPIDAVMHFSAYAYVGESVVDPGKYYANNVANSIALLDAMRRHSCNRFIFSSTCATYGVPQAVPITEDHPQLPINPYGWTKLMVERVLADYARAYDLRSVALRYFNAAGADPEGEIGEDHDPETHLIPLVLKAAAGDNDSLRVFGTDYPTPDGTCIRDYVHVSDLADAHILALEYLFDNNPSAVFNLGNSRGHSVKEVIDCAAAITGRRIPCSEAPRREGDPAVLVGSAEKIASVLGWKPRFPELERIIGTAWEWHRTRLVK